MRRPLGRVTAEHSMDALTPPNEDAPSRFQVFLRWITVGSARAPWLTLTVCCGLALAATWLTQTQLKFKTKRADLIDPKTEYHQRWLQYLSAFGDTSEDIVVVIEGDDVKRIEAAIDDLGQQVDSETEHFRNALYRVDLSKLREKALQFAGPDDLQMLLGQLDEFQVLLRDFKKLNLYRMVRELRFQLKGALEQPPDLAEIAAAPLVRQIHLLATSLREFSAEKARYQSPWQMAMGGQFAQIETQFADRYLMNARGTMGFLKVQPRTSGDDFNGPAAAIERLRALLAEVGSRHPEVRLGVTGVPVLESDEMRDSQASMTQASVLSFFGVTALLIWGLRGFRYPLLSTITMAVGMAWSFGLTTLVIGHLNILSVSFAAMLLGIGVDFSIVVLERYIELRHHGLDLHDALGESAVSIGPGTVTAAVTSAIGFFTALLTDFTGVAELGVIAGGGILLFLVAAFVVQPALIAIADRNLKPTMICNPIEANGYRRLLSQHALPICVICLAGLGFLGRRALEVKYDYNLLNLQADGLEPVEVQHRIFEQSDSSLLFAVSLADSAEEARDLKQKFLALPTVHRVEEIASVLPSHSTEETQLYVQAIHSMLQKLPDRPMGPRGVDPSQVGAELEKIETLLEGLPGTLSKATLNEVGSFLDRLDECDDARQLSLLREYQTRLTTELWQSFRALSMISETDPVKLDDLSPTLVDRFVSPGRKWLLQVYPKHQIWDQEPLAEFIADVRSVDPEATGTPLQTFEASRSIKQSYEKAGLYALFAAFAVLLLDFRSFKLAFLAMLPPMAGTVLLFGTMGHFQIDLNPANMIVLPLIMGIGVDGGVHVVHDSLHQKGRYEIGSTAFSAILVNTLTTMVGFGAMMIARHRGLYSLGLVLTLGVGACLLVSLVLLPTILAMLSWRRAPAVEAEALSSEPVSGLGHEPAVVFALSSAVPLASHQFATADVRAPRTGTYG